MGGELGNCLIPEGEANTMSRDFTPFAYFSPKIKKKELIFVSWS
jgi:hypothetical protein